VDVVLFLGDQFFMCLTIGGCIIRKELFCEFEVGEVSTCDIIVWVGNLLVECGIFSLPG
jgi:hypothetical protein